MTTKGIDCAQPIPANTAKAIAAQGYEFAARYLVPSNYAWKRLTRKEAEGITQAGMQIISVYETTASRPAGGASYGREDGKLALQEAIAIGQPEGSAIYFAVDYDAQPSDYDAIEAYLRAAAAEIGAYGTGVYGSYAVVEEMRKRGAAKHLWQTYAWSHGKKSASANVWQYQNGVTVAGHPVDLNESYGDEGWWNTNEEEDKAMSAEDADKIIRFLSAGWFATEDPEARAEFNRLANEVRKAAGLPTE
ncbi:DUF1906 domain-containing protein [Cohnella sp. GCM10027633]|uniref:DUF1906 domain-containing protein n=1 Tax=unclassified Cohnella TaxID=2636738 RepID=UPI003632D82E